MVHKSSLLQISNDQGEITPFYFQKMEDRWLNTIRCGFCVSHLAKNENCLADFIFI